MATYRSIIGHKINKVSSDPAEPLTGQMWYNSTTKTLRALGVTSAWSSGSPLITAKARYTQGGVGTQTAALAVGGYSTGIVTETEEYNGSGWSAGGALGTGRYGIYTAGTQTAGLAATGKGPPGVVTNVEEYNGSSWSEVNNNSTGRFLGSSCGTQTAGLIYGGAGPNNQTEEYDGTNWTNGGNLNTARNTGFSSGTQTAGLIAGGGPGSGNTAASEHYDGSSWTTVNSMNTARRSGAPSIAGLRTSSLAFGGFTTTMVTNTEAYDGTTWTNSPTLGTARYGLGGAGDSSGSALAFGGQNNGGTTYSLTEEFNSSTNTITVAAWASGGNLNNTISQGAGTGTQTAAIVAGGINPGSTPINNSESYDGSSWTNSPTLGTARTALSSAGTAPSTASLVFGGYLGPPYPNMSNATEEYNGSSWSEQNNLSAGRYGIYGFGIQTAAVAAGGDTNPITTAVEEYDGTSWTAGTALGTAKYTGAGTGILTAGLIFGGTTPGVTNATEEYDGTNWTTGGNLITAIQSEGAGTQTASLSFGGNPGNTAKTEGYDGTSWSTRPSMAVGRNNAMSAGGSAGSTAALNAGGYTTANVNTTEEFTGETSTTNIANFTTS